MSLRIISPMQITFYKYQGTGNDFIMIDNRLLSFPKTDIKLIANLCHRRFGIGADGLILIEKDEETDFKMVYYNSDGKESTMCGNGGRCAVAFAYQLGIIAEDNLFIAIDGGHRATVEKIEEGLFEVKLKMKDVTAVFKADTHCFLDTGSPHYVEVVEEVGALDVVEKGMIIRNKKDYAPHGTNVNFVQQINASTFKIRTYERGVEDETWSCGTGATAVALAMYATGKTQEQTLQIEVEGGTLEVSFEIDKHDAFRNVYLKGPASFVFKGEYISK